MTPDSSHLDPLTEIASLLATGIRRLHARSALNIAGMDEGGPDSPQDSSPDGLEVSGALPLHGTTGLTHGEDPATDDTHAMEARP